MLYGVPLHLLIAALFGIPLPLERAAICVELSPRHGRTGPAICSKRRHADHRDARVKPAHDGSALRVERRLCGPSLRLFCSDEPFTPSLFPIDTRICLSKGRLPDAIRVWSECGASARARTGAAAVWASFLSALRPRRGGAATALGPDRAGTPVILDPRKRWLELDRRDGSPARSRGRSAGRRARLRKWRAQPRSR